MRLKILIYVGFPAFLLPCLLKRTCFACFVYSPSPLPKEGSVIARHFYAVAESFFWTSVNLELEEKINHLGDCLGR